jgi:ATP-dependent Clp protease adaptor protein ClpS
MTPNHDNTPAPAPKPSNTSAGRAPLNQPVEELLQWNVVLLNDQDHSYNYVTTMIRELFKVPVAQAVELATRVDRKGRAVCFTTHKEYAEFKRDQILHYGKDELVEGSSGSMAAVIEPVLPKE